MNDVDFEEQEWQPKKGEVDDNVFDNPKIVQLFMKTGLVKTPKQAIYVLAGLGVVLLVVAGYIAASSAGWL